MQARRTPLTLLFLALPSLARAQVIPPAGEPPPPELRGAEQAAIEQQARDEYLREHTAEMQRRAEEEVDAERRAAWTERGRQLSPKAAVDKLPAIELSLTSMLSGGSAPGLGGSGGFKMRFKRGFGAQAEGGILAFRGQGQPGALITALAEPSIMFWGSGKRSDFGPDHATVRLGTQLLFPLDAAPSPQVPSVFIAPFFGLGGVLAFRPLYKSKGFIGMRFESRLGYRFAVGATSPLEGWMIDALFGTVLGF